MKRLISAILTVFMLSSFVVMVGAKNETGFKVGEIVEFGSYPQTQVTDQALAQTLESLEPDDSGSFDDYYGLPDISGYHSEYFDFREQSIMSYRDVTYNNERYRGIIIGTYRPEFTDRVNYNDEHQRSHGFKLHKWYWFKYEPLKWMVFDSEQGLALCTKVIDSQPFNNEYTEESIGVYTVYWNGQIKYANNFYTSYLLHWMNEDFYNAAFSEEEQADLVKFDTNTEPINGTADEDRDVSIGSFVSLLTYNQAYKDEVPGVWVEVKDEFKYSADDTKTLCTDYAKVQGLNTSSGVEWWLATPSDTSLHNYTVCPSEPYVGPEPEYQGSMKPTHLSNSMIVIDTGVGVRPVICLENVLAKQAVTEPEKNNGGWFSKEEQEDTVPVIAEGECNSKIDWSLSQDGVLTISGKGDMPEWDDGASSMPPWYYDNKSQIKSVVIEGKITSIGKLAFYGCENLESVTIPKSVTYIDECAFDECTSLKEIRYGSDVEDWAKIEIDEDNIDFSKLTIVCYSEAGGSNAILIGCVIGGGVLVAGTAVTGAAATGIIVYKKKKIKR